MQFIRTIMEDYTMNKDEFEGKWKQVKGQAKVWWGKLTDDDLEQVGGNFDKFAGLLQEKYGYTRERIEKEFDGRMAKFDATEQKNHHSANQDILEGKWKQMYGPVKEWWGKLTDNDLDMAEGKSEKIIGILMEKYGYARGQAEQEFNNRVAEYEASQKKTGVLPTVSLN
jgi:uncharacterized protein YjbJ (UPF0337 family)